MQLSFSAPSAPLRGIFYGEIEAAIKMKMPMQLSFSAPPAPLRGIQLSFSTPPALCVGFPPPNFFVATFSPLVSFAQTTAFCNIVLCDK